MRIRRYLVFIIAGVILSLFPAMGAIAAEKAESGKEEPSPSDNRQVWISTTVLCMTEDGYRALGDRNILPPGQLQSLIDGKKARELETLRFLMQSGQDSVTSIGHKFPITSFDPKASQYSIIFADVGMKFNMRSVISPDGRVSIELRSSFSTIEDYRQEIERDTVFYFPSIKTANISQVVPGIRNGETALISNLQGLYAEDLLRDLGEKATFYAKGSRLILAVTPFIFSQKTAVAESKSNEYPSCIEMRTIRISRGAEKKSLESYSIPDESLERLVKSGRAKVIDSERILTSGKSASLLLGRKYPLTYFDPRSGFYQVIYFDIGLKGDFELKPVGRDRWSLKIRNEFSNVNPASLFGVKRDQIPLKTYAIRYDTSLELGRGEAIIMLALRGEYYCKVLREILLPGLDFNPDDDLIFTVTVR